MTKLLRKPLKLIFQMKVAKLKNKPVFMADPTIETFLIAKEDCCILILSNILQYIKLQIIIK